MPALISMFQKLLPYFQIHAAVLLFGLTAILGRLLNEEGMSGLLIVVYRLLITLVSVVVFFPKKVAAVRNLSRKALSKIMLIGVLVAAHWVTFYSSIQVSNVSIALCALAATPFFTALIEPLMLRQAVKRNELLLGGLVVVGFVVVFGSAGNFLWGLLIGIISALLAATFSVMNKSIVDQHDTFTIMFVEFAAGLVFLLLVFPLLSGVDASNSLFPSDNAWIYLVLLSLFCTTLAFALNMFALKHLTSFTSNLTIALEPIYGIVIAYFYFQEHKDLNPYFYVGAAMIVLSVFIHPFLSDK